MSASRTLQNYIANVIMAIPESPLNKSLDLLPQYIIKVACKTLREYFKQKTWCPSEHTSHPS